MKNLTPIGIEKLEILPIETLELILTKKNKQDRHWRKGRSDYHHVGDYSPFTIANRVIENHIGQSFDKAFTKFCGLVPKYQQCIFRKQFANHVHERSWRYENYYIDERGIIKRTQLINQYKGPYYFKSDDYATELRHKITGHKKEDFESIHKMETFTYKHYGRFKGGPTTGTKKGKLLYYEYGLKASHMKPLTMRYKAQDKDFIPVTIKGWIKEFKSKSDPEYVRLVNEREKRNEKRQRKNKEVMANKAYDMISKTELQKKKDKELDKQKILSHGFDLITSFRTEKQTNPDLIQLKQ